VGVLHAFLYENTGDDVARHITKQNSAVTQEHAKNMLGPDREGRYKLAKIPLHKVKGTETTGAEKVHNLSTSKRQYPAIVLDRHNFVRDGNHRLAAAKKRGDSHISAYVPVK
jgi:hypothetical protein